MELVVETRDGAASDVRRVPEPDPATVLAQLRSLDGAATSQLALDAGRGEVLIVGGGNEGRYVVTCLVNTDEHSYQLLGPDGSDASVAVVTGGQEALFPADAVVDLALASRAVESFARTGARDPDLRWRLEF
jgi:hypothetical protein